MAPKMLDILSETKRIINTQPRHYFTLTLIFLLPLSFFSLIFQLLFKHFQQQPIKPTLITSLIYLLSLLISSILTYSATITITYSVFHASFNRSVKLKEAIKSISHSFFPILATDIVIFIIIFITFTIFALLIGIISFLIIYLGGVSLEKYPYFLVLCSMVSMLVFIPFVMYFVVNLSLVKVIVVVESRWGFETLKESWKLVKGMRRLIVLTFSLFGSLQGILLWISSYSWILIFVISPIIAMLLLYNIAVCTVLYMYCKEKNGELVDKEFGKDKDEASFSLITS